MTNDNNEDLEKRLKVARREFDKDYNPKAAAPKNESMSDGARAGIELVGAFLGGGLIGFGLDKLFGTSPACFLIFLILGVITGFYNVYKITQGLGSSVGFMQLHKKIKPAKQEPNLDNENR